MALGESHAKRMETDLIIVAWHRSGIGAWYWAVLPYPANEPVLRAADSRERGIMSETRLERRSAFVNSLPAEYFLFVGALEPDKNLALCRGSISVGGERQRIVLPSLVIVGARVPGGRGSQSTRQPDLLCRYFLRRPSRPRPARGKGYKLPSGKK